MPQFGQQPRYHQGRARRQQSRRLVVAESFCDHVDRAVRHRRGPPAAQSAVDVPPVVPRRGRHEGGDLPARGGTRPQPCADGGAAHIPGRILQRARDRFPLARDRGQEHGDLPLELVTAVKIIKQHAQLTGTSQFPRLRRQQPHPAGERQRVQLSEQRGGLKTHNGHYWAAPALPLLV